MVDATILAPEKIKETSRRKKEGSYVKEVISISSSCRDKGVNEIIISGLICHKG